MLLGFPIVLSFAHEVTKSLERFGLENESRNS